MWLVEVCTCYIKRDIDDFSLKKCNGFWIKISELSIRLRLAMERMVDKTIFPYNAQPLLKVLSQCEALYERT